MKRKYRKLIAFVVCTALLIGWLPVNPATVSDAADSSGTSTESEYELLVEGSIDNGKVQLKVNTDNLTGWDKMINGYLSYYWYVGSSESDMEQVNDTSSETYTLSEALEGTCIKVCAKYDAGFFAGFFGSSVELTSRVFQVEDASLEVDLISGVSSVNVSKAGEKDGKILGTTYDMIWSRGVANQGSSGGGQDIAELEEGQYRVGYNEGTCLVTPLRKGLYAIYTIGVGRDASTTSKPTADPSEIPGATAEPESTPWTTVEPTKAPDSTAEPTNTPGDTAEPTKAPGTTTEPTKTPGDDTKPTATPPAQNTEIDMEKAGEEITLGDVVYQSTGSNSVAYAGNKNAGKSVSVPDTVKVNGKSYPVTELSAGAFSGSKVQTVSLGKNVKKIGKGAFKNCKQLKKVTFPSKMQTLGEEAFSGCVKLGSASLPASVKTVGAKAFKNCKSMKKFSLGKKPAKTKSGKIMFGATGATKVSIGANALENCLNLRSVIINSQVTKIGNSTFKNCKKLASMLVKSLKLQKVGNQALKGVSNCKISVPTIRLKKYRTLFKNKGQGKKVVVARA